ncbi:addiction module protein [Candidatus Viridilinea mediisalina]|uniref:Addiction module protein n=1 Tax=Candidatus Viridilinea mediisalina TaxID=2024553 RepID=A0A2A6RKE1_9CHLR|nr:addiction module protein [Candidatus Viridilinea mediisalina]PDW03340.1 hypothetical protein CJ255_09475 [Candidatus Viridilinea mediisalina]
MLQYKRCFVLLVRQWEKSKVVNLTQLSLAERIQLVEDLWDTIAVTPDAVLMTDVQKAELDRRLARYQARPDDSRSWAEVKATLLHRAQP